MVDSPKVAKRVLGRGLSALISTPSVPVAPQFNSMPVNSTQANAAQRLSVGVGSNLATPGIQYVPIASVKNNPSQPRQLFGATELAELTESIKTLGVIQPVLVRPIANSSEFEIVAGERRWRAAQSAGLAQLPVIIKELSNKDSLELALVENIQRANLSPIEEARGYERLSQEFALSQKDIAERVGKDRATVANLMRLISLPKEVQDLVETGKLSVGHAKVILGIRDPKGQLSLAKKAVSEELSVRSLEALVQRVTVLDSGRRLADQSLGRSNSGSQSAFPDVVDRLRTALGTKVTLQHTKAGKGKVVIEYFSEAELDRLVDRICKD